VVVNGRGLITDNSPFVGSHGKPEDRDASVDEI